MVSSRTQLTTPWQVIMLIILILTGRISILGQVHDIRVYTADHSYFIEVSEINNRIVLYLNKNSPKMIWEKVINNLGRVYISKGASRVVIFQEFYQTDKYCPTSGSFVILDEKGDRVRSYDYQELGFKLICNESQHRKTVDILDGVVRISDDEKFLDVGSIKLNESYQEQVKKLNSTCGKFWECRDQGISFPDEYLKDRVWRFDMRDGALVSDSVKNGSKSQLLFPQYQQQFKQYLSDNTYLSENKIYSLNLMHDGKATLVDNKSPASLIWTTNLPNLPYEYPTSVFISDTGKRVVLIGKASGEIGNSEEIVFKLIDDQGKVIKTYQLGQLISPSLCQKYRGRVLWGGLDKHSDGDTIELTTYAKRGDIRESVIEPWTDIDNRVFVRQPMVAPYEKIKLNLITGEIIAREKILIKKIN